jgi:hypothetical protein
MTKEHMFWDSVSEGGIYFDGVPVPRVTYRCKGSAKRQDTHAVTTHRCKKVTDHPGGCECICGQKFNEKVEALT